MAFSSNPAVREVQNGVGFAFRPIQGALDGAAGSVASVAAAIAEIDRLRVDNAALRAENERLATENARLEEIRRENEQLTALLQLRAGFDYETVAATVIARESSEFRRLVVLDKGTDDGIAVGDVAIAAGGALAGRVVEVGPDSAKVVLLTDGEFDGHRPADDERGDRRGRRPARRRPDHAPDRFGRGRRPSATRSSPPASSSAAASGRRTRRASSSGRSSTSGATPTTSSRPPTSSPPPTLDRLEYVLVITDYEGGLPPIEQQPVDCGNRRHAAPGRAAVPGRRARHPRRPPKP